jgi:hypothetical protein
MYLIFQSCTIFNKLNIFSVLIVTISVLSGVMSHLMSLRYMVFNAELGTHRSAGTGPENGELKVRKVAGQVWRG